MDVATVTELIREALGTALLLALPLLGVALVIGVITSLLQAMTSLQDSTLNFVPKVLGLLAVLAVSAPNARPRYTERPAKH